MMQLQEQDPVWENLYELFAPVIAEGFSGCNRNGKYWRATRCARPAGRIRLQIRQ
jgi:hypothetical protein